jgi:hypothetical protein
MIAERSGGRLRTKVLNRDLELVNERHGIPLPLGGYIILDKICYQK